MKNIFKVDQTLGVSKFRFYLLRVYYIVIILMLGIEVWTNIFTHKGMWDPLPAVAFSFWGAFTVLAILGILHPLKMVPLLLVQFSYKLIWLIILGYPLWTANRIEGFSAELTKANLIGVVLDLLIIPWPYVFKNYILIRKKNK